MCVCGWRGGLGIEMLHETINIAPYRYCVSISSRLFSLKASIYHQRLIENVSSPEDAT